MRSRDESVSIFTAMRLVSDVRSRDESVSILTALTALRLVSAWSRSTNAVLLLPVRTSLSMEICEACGA